jgi:ABC-type oligopeptide transport system ATPase subunit
MVQQASHQTRSDAQVGDVLVDVKDLRVYFPVTAGLIFQRKVADVKAVDGINFAIKKGETLGLVGESGCGKSTTGRAILQLYRPSTGSINFDGHELTKMRSGELRRFRRRMQMIFQDPYASLNPRMSVGPALFLGASSDRHFKVAAARREMPISYSVCLDGTLYSFRIQKIKCDVPVPLRSCICTPIVREAH